LTPEYVPWNPSLFSDQVEDKVYQQVFDKENCNPSTNLLDASTVEVKQNNSNLLFYDPSDLLKNNLNGKQAHLLFYTDKVHYAYINYTVPTNTNLHYIKALPIKRDYENLSLICIYTE
jgi:hypothetical protein